MRDLLKERGYTIRTFADATGIAKSTVGTYVNQNKEPSVTNFLKMCKVLQMTPSQLAQVMGYDIEGIPSDLN